MVVEPDRPQRIVRLTPLADVRARLAALVEPVTPRAADLSAARGRTLAEDVIIPAPIPATARALRDGWAVRSDLTAAAGGYAPAPRPFAMRGDARMAAPEDLANALAAAGADAVIAIGGTGSGRRDVTVQTLASMGEVLVHGVALLPGETTALGTVGARPVLALPGRLDAALAAWHVLGRLMLARLAANQETPSMRSARLTHKVSSAVGLAELVPVRCEGLSATPIASGYVPLAALAQANGWILINADSEGYPAQSEVVIRPWP